MAGGRDVRGEDGHEHDWFDLIGPHYLVARHPATRDAHRCWRTLPTTGPCMLRDVCPMLLDGGTAPADRDVWEISRFAVANEYAQGTFGFRLLPADLLRAMVRFGIAQRLEAIFGVTSAAVERTASPAGFQGGAPRTTEANRKCHELGISSATG